MNVLFICTGNTCRSPMAMAICKKLFPNIKSDSAGIYVNPNDKISINSIDALKHYNIDLCDYKPKQLSHQLIQSADIIVPMTNSHKTLLINLGVDESKIKMLGEEISDPYMQSISIYKKCAEQLYLNIQKMFGVEL